MWRAKLLHAFAKLRDVTICLVVSICLSVSCLSASPSALNNSASSGRIFIKFDIWAFFENVYRKFTFHYDLTKIMGTVYRHIYIYGDILLNYS